MTKNTEPQTAITNRLLSALPKKEYQRLLPNMEQFALTFSNSIYEPGDTIRYVYFPNSGIISLLCAVEERAALEVGIVGNEGMIGLPVIVGLRTARNRAIVQGTGTAMRMKATTLQKECKEGGPLSHLLQCYMHSLLTQIAQSAACNRFHPINSRLARWLLMMHDHMLSDGFQLTQEFMSNMLGVRREGVNKAAGILQERQLISYSRGNIKIVNRAGLEADACSCYMIIKEEYENFLCGV